MKRTILILALILSVSINAQKQNPIFEKDGDLVKGTYFHDNGEIAQTGHFLNKELHGEWKMYDVDGKKIATGKYSHGEKSGKWFFWKNKELKEVDFVDSRIVSVTKWNNTATLAQSK